MVSALIIISIVFSFVIGISKVICDLSDEGKLKGDPTYWHKKESSNRKWKLDNKGQPIIIDGKHVELYCGSSTVFVALRDGWHLFQLIGGFSNVICYVCVGALIAIGIILSHQFWYLFMILCYPFSRFIFHLFHDTSKILKK